MMNAGVPKSEIPDWASTDFDQVYVLGFSAGMSLESFHIAHENFTAPSHALNIS